MEKISFIEEIKKVTKDCFNKGWNERNGGNISYRLNSDEVSEITAYLKSSQKYPLDMNVKQLANEYFLVTGSGKFFRNVELDPKANIGIIKIDDTGDFYEIVWGLENAVPTSELPTHLLSHKAMKSSGDRVIMHTHATNVIALTFVHDGGSKEFTTNLYKMMSECLVVFPQGIKLIEWMVPGTIDIGDKTSSYINDYNAVVWVHHGIFAKADTLDNAFGLIDTIDKAAGIYLKVLSTNKKIVSEISNQNLKDLAKQFNVKYHGE